MIMSLLFYKNDGLFYIKIKITFRLLMTKSNMLEKIVCCNLKQFIGFLKQKDPINFWTISEKNTYCGQRRVRGAAVRALTETQHSSSRLQRAVLQKSAATPQPAAAVS